MKKYWFSFPIIVFLVFTACRQGVKSTTSPDLLKLIPAKTAAFIHSKDLGEFTRELSNNTFINENKALPLLEFLAEAYTPLTKIHTPKKSLLTFSKIGRDEIATTLIAHEKISLKDSTEVRFKESFTYNGEEVKTYELGESILYQVNLNDILIVGNSKLVVENMIRLAKEKIEPDEQLSRLFKSNSSKKNTLFINFPEFQKIYNVATPQAKKRFPPDFTNWLALDLDLHQNSFRMSGVTLAEDKEILGILKGTKAQENELSQVTPTGAIGYYSFTFDDFSKIEDNLSFYRKEDYPQLNTDLFDDIHEVGQVYMRDGEAIVLNSLNEEETEHWLNTHGTKTHKTHRGHTIYRFESPNFFYQALHPLINNQDLGFFTKLDNFFLFSNNETVLENLISNVENGSVLAKSDSYKKIGKKLDDKSTMLFVGATKTILKTISEQVDKKHREAYEKNADLLNYHHAAIQFINHDNFTYINGSFIDTQQSTSESGVEIGRIKPGENIRSGPWFFINWRTKHYDIAVQGESNTLYVYNQQGQLRWKRQLDGKILGDIQTLDIYQNGRKQMAFVTPQTFYIIDREGNVVKPFNKTFKNTITQPLALFDYNNNGRFRFVIVQDEHLVMLDKQLNTVKGFEFTKASSKVLQTPKHFRFGNKDYLVIPEGSGKLNILNPRGQTRVAINEKIDFSDNQWYVNNSLFTSTDKNGNLIQIDRQGNVKKENLKLDENHKFTATANTRVSFSGNKLTIKGKTSTLDYGHYTKPKIFYIADKLYINITDTQNNKVYLFDSSSKLLSGFPVYGRSEADLQNMDGQGNLELIVKGEDDSLLIYEVK